MARSFQRNRQLVRSLEMVRLLETMPRTLQFLSLHFEVTPRTIRRDIEALELAGFAVCQEDDESSPDTRAKRWRLLKPSAGKSAVPAHAPGKLALRFADAPALLQFVESLHSQVGAIHDRLKGAAA